MKYLFYVFFYTLIFFSGGFMSVIAAILGIAMIFYLAFKWGPTLTLIALPVVVCFILFTWLDDFALMYCKYILIFVPIFLLITMAACKYFLGEGYKKIVIAVTGGFAAITLAGLAAWMYLPQDLPVPDRFARVEVQHMSESVKAIYPDPAALEPLMNKLEKADMCGTFKELTDYKSLGRTYRLSFVDENGKELKTYYFISKYDVIVPIGKHQIFYRCTDDSTFPYKEVVNMFNNVVHPEQ